MKRAYMFGDDINWLCNDNELNIFSRSHGMLCKKNK